MHQSLFWGRYKKGSGFFKTKFTYTVGKKDMMRHYEDTLAKV